MWGHVTGRVRGGCEGRLLLCGDSTLTTHAPLQSHVPTRISSPWLCLTLALTIAAPQLGVDAGNTRQGARGFWMRVPSALDTWSPEDFRKTQHALEPGVGAAVSAAGGGGAGGGGVMLNTALPWGHRSCRATSGGLGHAERRRRRDPECSTLPTAPDGVGRGCILRGKGSARAGAGEWVRGCKRCAGAVAGRGQGEGGGERAGPVTADRPCPPSGVRARSVDLWSGHRGAGVGAHGARPAPHRQHLGA